MPILADHHMHTPLCQHATGPMEDYIERGIERGLRAVGFSDHNPLPDGLGANVRMKESELDYYVQRVLDLRYQYRGKIDVLLGLELDYIPGLEPYLEKQIARYPWDYIIGSVHYMDPDCRVGSWSRHFTADVDEHYARYFQLMRQLAASGLCDILAHFDVVKRTGHAPTPRALEEAKRTLEAIAPTGLCIEINTSGYRHPELPEPQPYPSLPLALHAHQLGIPLLVNSDAHAPDQVAMKFAEMESWLKQNNCRRLVQFSERKKESYAL